MPGCVCAFLELTTPDLATAVDDLVTQGVRRVTVVPMFLGVGRHAREDLPVLMAELRARHPDVEYRAPALGGRGRPADGPAGPHGADLTLGQTLVRHAGGIINRIDMSDLL